jgi:hypothetical protein
VVCAPNAQGQKGRGLGNIAPGVCSARRGRSNAVSVISIGRLVAAQSLPKTPNAHDPTPNAQNAVCAPNAQKIKVRTEGSFGKGLAGHIEGVAWLQKRPRSGTSPPRNHHPTQHPTPRGDPAVTQRPRSPNTQRPGVTLPSPNAQGHPTPNAHCPSGTQRSQYRLTYDGPLGRAPLAPGDLAAAAIWHPTHHPTPCGHPTPVETWHTVPDNSNRHGSPARGRPCLRSE